MSTFCKTNTARHSAKFPHRISQGLHEGSLEWGDQRLEIGSRAGHQQAQGPQDGSLDRPREAVSHHSDQRACHLDDKWLQGLLRGTLDQLAQPVCRNLLQISRRPLQQTEQP